VKRKKVRYSPPASPEAKVLPETSAPDVAPLQINVRAAKDRLSSLLEEAARGHEIVITSDGQPKARLVPVQAKRKRFKVDWKGLLRTPSRPGPSADELIRAERDGRP
jgi:prevent-host-death family protein